MEALLAVGLEGGERILTTGNHPFWVAARGWVQAMDLGPGDRLKAAGETGAVVGSISVEPTPSAVWNLAVEDSHSFFVAAGASTVLVHNTNPGLRTYIVYEVPLYNKKGEIVGTYVGRASMPYTKGVAGDKAIEDCLKRRFKRHHRAKSQVGFDGKNAVVRWSGIYDSGKTWDKRKLYETMRGAEDVLEEIRFEEGLSVNRNGGGKRPVAETNENRATYRRRAEEFRLTICPLRQ